MIFFQKLILSFCLLAGLTGVAQAQDEFVIQPGDILQVTVWKEEGLDRETLILPDGSLTFPLIGSIQAKGLTINQLQDNIKSKISHFIPDASVTIMVKAPLGHTVNVIGQVGKPGEIIMQGKMSVMQALSQAGGLTQFADEDDIIVLRGEEKNKKSLPFPYDDISRGRDLDKDIVLLPGDVIVVPTAGLF